LDGVVNTQHVRAILGVRESTCDSWEGASCTENCNVGRHLKSWTDRASFLWRDSEQWALFTHVAQYFVSHVLVTIFRYKLGGSCRMEPERTQRKLFWTFCMTLSNYVSYQTSYSVKQTTPTVQPEQVIFIRHTLQPVFCAPK
jgi:hypothetical protein